MPAVISRRRRAAAAVVAIAAVAGLAIAPVASADNRGQSRLERLVLSSLRSAGFTEVIDGNATFPYPQIAHTPNIDVGVIRLDKKGRPREAVNALMSRDYPRGVLAPIGKDLRSVGVRFRAWNLNRFDGANGFTWTTPPFTAADDVVAGRERADGSPSLVLLARRSPARHAATATRRWPEREAARVRQVHGAAQRAIERMWLPGEPDSRNSSERAEDRRSTE